MDTLFLLRSYGDFVIALFAFSKAKPERNIQLVASLHLKPLYDELRISGIIAEIPFLRFEQIGIRHQILACFTNRYLLQRNTLTELVQLRRIVNHFRKSSTGIYFEQSARISWPRIFTGNFQAGYIHNGTRNIYKAYNDFLGTESSYIVQQNEQKAQDLKQVLIIPGSRKENKALPVDLVNATITYCRDKGYEVTVAGLITEIKNYDQPVTAYSNFHELIQLIRQSDMLISADSLPAHLAQLMGKPHWILYNKQVNNAWLTPFSETRKYYASFDEWGKMKAHI